jgi:hypothetical protein
MYVCMYIYICMYVYLHIWVCIRMYMYIYIYIYEDVLKEHMHAHIPKARPILCELWRASIYVYVCVYISAHAHIFVYIYIYIYIFVYICICIYIYICMYIYVYIVYIHIYVHTYVTWILKCMHACTHPKDCNIVQQVYWDTQTRTYVYIYIYTCIYRRTYIARIGKSVCDQQKNTHMCTHTHI